MRTKFTTTSVVLAAIGLTAMVPAGMALDLGCDTGLTNVIAPPAGAFGPNWSPDCIVLVNGGTVTFTQADGIPHGATDVAAPRATACWDLGNMLAGQSTSARIVYDADFGEVLFYQNGAAAPRVCEVAENPNFNFNAEGDLEIAYWCGIHQGAMPGTIVLDI